ncbi:MAG: hypothetical protein JW706_06785 [Opitutales bacterium]|nr:hypothetical protein [Opitutales bacterium]
MGSRIQPEEWHALIQILAFLLCFLAFLYFVLRALLMKKDTAGKLAAMPLDEPGDPDNRNRTDKEATEPAPPASHG